MTKNTGDGAPAVNSVYSLSLKCTLSYQSSLRRKNAPSLIFAFFVCFSSIKSVLMYLITCWKYKQSHILISPCRNDPSQLQNCRTKRFFTVSGTLLATWRQRKRNPCSRTLTHPQTEYFSTLQNRYKKEKKTYKFERFIRFDTWGPAPFQQLCQRMVRTWYVSHVGADTIEE